MERDAQETRGHLLFYTVAHCNRCATL